MRAAQINTYGDSSVIQVSEIENPVVTEGKVLIEVHGSSVNPFDSKLRSGLMKEMIPLTFPFTIGGDIAGVVTEVGDGVTSVAVGDKVYGQAAGVAGNSGALAEYALTAADQVAVMPSNLDFNQAASLPLVAVSASQALTTHIDLQPGQKIFIHGGAGGIGTIAIQIAKSIGAYVATTASGDNIAAVKELGADEVIDYKTTDFSEALSDFDAVFDTVGGDDFTKALHILKSGGIAVSMAGQADDALVSELGVSAISQATHVNTESLQKVTELVESGAIIPHIDKVFPFDNVVDAFDALDSGSVKGKVVVQIR